MQGGAERPVLAALVAAAFLAAAAPAGAKGPQARPGALNAEPATFHALGVRWIIHDDDNANARIEVAFRKAGESAWRAAMPLFRPPKEYQSPHNRIADGLMFAGSIVDLEPGTRYDVRLWLIDPDGVDQTRTLQMATRAEPVAPAPLCTLHVRPDGGGARGAGSEGDPLRGLTAAAAAAQPGDLVLFRPDRYRSTGVQLTRDGTADRPIVWRSSEPGQAILDGGGAETLIEARERRHWWFEGFTFTNAQRLLRVMRASDIVIRRNLFEVAGLGVTGQGAIHAESVGVLVLDNVFRGTTSWPRSKGIEPVYAVNLTGSGHIVAYNLIENVGDGAHIGNHGRLSASDYHNNDIIGATDDGLEIDHSDANVRVYRNRITNAFAGISGQPVFGGPVYVFRNVIFNTEYTPFKLHNDMAGMFIFHNTSVRRGVPFVIRASGDNVTAVTTRNNLFIGNAAPALQSSAGMVGCDFDGDGYAWGQGGFAEWNGRAYQSPLAAKEAGQLYARIGIVSLLPGRDLSAGLRPPADPKRRFTPADYDPRLIAGSRAVDRATLIANFNDGFAGSAPDLGCCELDQPLPHYGPRAPR